MRVHLSEQEIIDLQQAGRMLHDLLPHLDDLDACGHDCSILRAQNERTQKIISELLARFAPSPRVQ